MTAIAGEPICSRAATPAMVASVPSTDCWRPVAPPADYRHGRVRRQAVADEHVGDLPNAVRAQHDDFGARGFRHLRPINAGGGFRRVLRGRRGE